MNYDHKSKYIRFNSLIQGNGGKYVAGFPSLLFFVWLDGKRYRSFRILRDLRKPWPPLNK